jgi:phosphoribosylformimino-5-aminoimidazole carboxamide ribotide isomerase
MKLIPALDLKNNKIVTSSIGNKREYQEISSKLAPSSDPLRFLEYILSLYDFNTIYLADLDSIKGFNAENFLISEILQEHKNITFIIDNGVRLYSQLNAYNYSNFTQIIATETFKEYQLVINEEYDNYILSLDIINKKIICKNNQYKKLRPEKNLESIVKTLIY